MNFIKLNGQEIALNDIKDFAGKYNLSHIEIKLQSAPVKVVGVNGCGIEDAIFLCKEILCSFQSKLPCRETAIAITKLEEAMLWCDYRTKGRQSREVEGTNAA